MQANPTFEGACWTQIQVFGQSLNTTVQEALVMYLPANWFNFIDRLRIDLVDFNAMQVQCQIYNILGELKVIFSVDGLIGLFSRIVPQAFIFRGEIEKFQTFFAEGDYIQAATIIGTLSRNIIGQPVN